MNEKGIVEAIDKGTITVKTLPHDACKCCSACGKSGAKKMNFEFKGTDRIKPGDVVVLTVKTKKMITLYMLIYGAPLALFILSLIGIFYKTGDPLKSFALSFVLLIAGFAVIGRYMEKNRKYFEDIDIQLDKSGD
jgi:positive regulator of sigma E activity